LIILALIAAVAMVVYATGGTVFVWVHLMYLPIILAAAGFGIYGGIAAALIGALVLGPYMPMDAAHGLSQPLHNWLFRVVFFLLVGTLSGLISNVLNRQIGRIKRREEHIKYILNNTKDVIFQTDLDGNYIYGNAVAEQMTGYPLPELLQMNMMQLVAPEHHALVSERLKQRIANEAQEKPLEIEIQRKDGRRIWTELTSRNVCDEEGRLVAIQGVARDITERKRAEENISKLAAIVESSEDAIISKTLDGIIASWNRSAEKLFGYTAQEAIGSPMLIIFPPERVEEERKILKLIADGETIEHFETERRTKSGKLLNVSVTISPIRNAGGKITGASKIVRDITGSKQAAEAVTLFRTLLDHANDAIEVVDPKTWRYLDVNARASQIHGYTREEYLALTVSDVDPQFAAGGPKTWNAHLEAFQRFGSLVFESEHRRKDGSVFPVEVNASYIRLQRDYVLAVVRDITERKRAEQAVRHERDFSEAVLNSLPGVFYLYDQNGRFLRWNKNFEQVTGYTAEEMKTLHPLDFFAGAEKDLVAARINEVLQKGASSVEADFLSKDGRKTPYYFTGVLAQIDGQNCVVGVGIDVTARKQAELERANLEVQFRQSQKMEAIGQLASGVAHDFNNILAIIQIQSDLLKADGNLSPSQMGFASEIGEATQRAAALTRQLLLFSRKGKMEPRELDLNQSINDMTKMLRRTLGGNVELQFKFSMQPLFVNADPGMIDQVLMNLAVNARDAMPRGGKIIIEISAVEFDESIKHQYAQARPGSFVCLNVSDTGSGIPPEILPKIFEPFFTTKEVGKGTGLGLATVFGIVQQHQGWINVYSEVGQGTAFRIYLPHLARISDQKFVAPMTEQAPGGKETILVVEDEPKLRASVINILSRLGYNVLEASDGANALEVWKKQLNEVRFAKKLWNQDLDGIHLLLTDMVMPGGITGKDLGERLLKENPKLKVIYVSGYNAEVAGKDFPLKEGVNFLTKPFQAQKLAQTIRNSLDVS
jgi:PAS domain S-box-containing protein